MIKGTKNAQTRSGIRRGVYGRIMAKPPDNMDIKMVTGAFMAVEISPSESEELCLAVVDIILVLGQLLRQSRGSEMSVITEP